MEIKDTAYQIINLQEKRYRFQFNKLVLNFDPQETKEIDLRNISENKSLTFAWRLALKHLPSKVDEETNEFIFEIKEVE